MSVSAPQPCSNTSPFASVLRLSHFVTRCGSSSTFYHSVVTFSLSVNIFVEYAISHSLLIIHSDISCSCSLTCKQRSFAFFKAPPSQGCSCVRPQWVTCSLTVDFPRLPAAHSHSSDGLVYLFHPSHPCSSSSSPPTSPHSHFHSSLKNDSCRAACLINVSKR